VTRVECFFDCSSPWGYMGFLNLQKISSRLCMEVEWRPVVVGFVFAESNPDVYLTRRVLSPPLKGSNELRDLERWADYTGVEVNHPPLCGHPVNTVKCMRGCLALKPLGKLVAFAAAAGEALWRDGRNLGHTDVLEEVCRTVGVDPDWFFQAIEDRAVKDRLAANNTELARRGGFGVPTYFVDGERMYFGNNRLALVERRMREGLRFDPSAA
jgi:2-hydroxychromene-2-carboxylate isomerase